MRTVGNMARASPTSSEPSVPFMLRSGERRRNSSLPLVAERWILVPLLHRFDRGRHILNHLLESSRVAQSVVEISRPIRVRLLPF